MTKVEAADVEPAEARNGIQVIARAASILRALKDQRDGLSLGQIAERVDLPRSTVQRIVGALQKERLLISAGPERGIRLGPELQSLADGSRINLVELIGPYLRDLSRETEETVDLAVLRGNRLIFLDQIPGTHRLRAVSSVGDVFPLTTTANGKACLALMTDDAMMKVATKEWEETGTTRSAKSLLAEIRKVRRTGLAFDEDEHTSGISAIGLAFTDPLGSLYAVSIPVPTARLAVKRAALCDALRRFGVHMEALLVSLKGT